MWMCSEMAQGSNHEYVIRFCGVHDAHLVALLSRVEDRVNHNAPDNYKIIYTVKLGLGYNCSVTRLATLRKALGLTQVQLAQAARTTQRAVSYYENDDGLPLLPL
jgi:DNA-binding XRE family transcriptional regulator